MSANRVQNRVAWDHTVLNRTAARLEPRRSPRPIAAAQDPGHPVATIILAWVLIVWSTLTAWALWTGVNADAHISMRFLMRGDFEEILGVAAGLGWACIPAWTAFFLARHVRMVTLDDVGIRAYWTSAIVSIVAAMGIMRPTWDERAGSRFARSTPAAESATDADSAQTSADDGSFDASMLSPDDLLHPSNVALALDLDNASSGEAANALAAMADASGATPAPANGIARNRAGARYAAMLRAMERQRAIEEGAFATVDTRDGPE